MNSHYFSAIALLLITVTDSLAQSPDMLNIQIKNTAISIDTGEFYKADAKNYHTVFEKLANFKVLGLGEQSHGTHEFFQIKNALISRLVRDYGYNLIGLEAPFAEVENLNLYVLEGKGNIEEILKSFRQYTFECSEFESFVGSIRNSNQKGAKVKFFGFDFQSPFGSLSFLAKINELNRGANADKIQSLIDSYTNLNNELYSHSIDSATLAELKMRSKVVLNDMQLNGDIKRNISFKQHVENYSQFLELNSLILKNDSISMLKISVLRDSLMALNVLNRVEGNKILLWAHNAHLQKTPSVYSKSMGAFLKDKLNKDYAVLGQTTAGGYFTAFDPVVNKMSSKNIITKPGLADFEYYLSLAEMPVLFLESAKIKNINPQITCYRMLGYGVTDRQFVKGNLFTDYDFIIHSDQSTGNNSYYLR